MSKYSAEKPRTFPRLRLGLDAGIILRGAAAFDREWKNHGSSYVQKVDQINPAYRRNMGIYYAAFVDSFLVYISELMLEIFNKHPFAITTKSMSQKLAWQFTNIEDLRWSIIESSVQELSYKSFGDLDDFLSEKIGLRLAQTKFGKIRMTYLIECRNSIVHNRGRFSAVSDTRLGAKGRLHHDLAPKFNIEKLIAYLIDTADDLDDRAAQKFDLAYMGADEHFAALSKAKPHIEELMRDGKRAHWKFHD